MASRNFRELKVPRGVRANSRGPPSLGARPRGRLWGGPGNAGRGPLQGPAGGGGARLRGGASSRRSAAVVAGAPRRFRTVGRGRAALPGPGQGGVRGRAGDLQRVPGDHEELQVAGDRHAGRDHARVDALRGLREAHLRLQHVPARGLQDRRARRVAGPAPRRDRRAAQEHAAAGPTGRGEEGHGQAQAQGPTEEGGAGARRRRRAPAGRIPGSRFNT